MINFSNLLSLENIVVASVKGHLCFTYLKEREILYFCVDFWQHSIKIECIFLHNVVETVFNLLVTVAQFSEIISGSFVASHRGRTIVPVFSGKIASESMSLIVESCISSISSFQIRAENSIKSVFDKQSSGQLDHKHKHNLTHTCFYFWIFFWKMDDWSFRFLR